MLRKRIVRTLLGVLGAIGVYALYIVATNNFHTVVPGEFYRSAQPSGAQVAKYHERYGIKTILNLRGPHPELEWYREEKADADANGIRLIDYPLSSGRDVSGVKLDELLDVLSTAERPILVHCLSGADRSGIVSAFYVAGVAGGSEFYAELQLTPLFGHMPFGFLEAWAMDRSFEAAEARLGFPDS
ncbi:MAG TPA: tyrosine protein phosphatase [Methyloceanibacter sp.]|nr:tyrosine protein phosphatase [Methyloceanibacter sp.]